MADNIDVTPGSGKTIAADEIASALYQRVKPTWGDDGSANDTSLNNPLPIQGARANGGTDTASGKTHVTVGGSDGTNLRPVLTDSSGRVAVNVNGTVPVSIATAPALVASSAIIGKVGIDQTTPGTTNGVQVNVALPAGTNVIGKFSTDQTTHGTTDLVAADITKVGGSALALGQALSAASIPVVLPAAQITSLTAPVLGAGSALVGKVGIDQTTPGTTNKVNIGTDGTVAIGTALPAGTNTIGAAFQAVSATQATGTTARLASAASTNATSVKASAGMLYRITAANTNAAARYLKFYNKASAPTVGTDTPLFTIYLPASGGFSEEFDIPVSFSTGIAYAMTTGVADTDTAAVSLNDIHGLIIYA
jgi:hypothetical protein